MKKIFLLLLASCLWAGSICAQSPANRTATTVIADVLAQVPAQDKGAYTQQQEDLLSAGEEGIAQLVEMLETNDEGKAKVELALSGLTHFASAPEQSDRRLTVVNAYLSAIDRLSDAEAKAFVIRQLEVVGGDECVAKLSSLLGDESLSSPAAVALAAIRSAASGQALVDALGKPLGSRQKENVVRAIGHIQAAGAEKILKTLAADADIRLRGAVWYALSRTGSAASLPVLAAAAGQVRYAPEVTGAVNAYLTLINRLLAQGNVEEAEKAAAALWKQAKKAGEVQTCAAALQALMAAQPDKVAKYLKDALKDKNRDYRNAALEYALDYDVAALSEELAGYLKKANAECKVDIMSWFAKVFDNPDKQRQLSSAFTGVFVRQLADKDMAVKEAAAALLAKSGEEAAIRALVALLDGADERQIALARNVLSFAKGDIVPLLTPRLSTASARGKVAILELLAMRKADGQAPAVLEQLNAPAAEVRRAAGAALKDVVALKDIPALYDLLEKSDTAAVAFVQQAIAAALKSLPSAEQLEMLVARLSKTAQAKQPLYYPVLVASGDRKALELIADRFKTATAQDKDAAFHALLGWEGIESAAELEAICRDTKASGYFDRALKRYIQLASSAGLTGENRRIFLTNALDMAGDDDQRNEILKHIGKTGSYLGMLLAGEYLDQPPLQQSAAGAVMNIALNNKSYTGKNVKRLLEKASGILDNPDASYQKEAIRKHLSEMPNEKGFAAIFNGKDLTGWKGLVGNPLTRAQMKPAKLAQAQTLADKAARQHWIPEDGVLVFDGAGGDNLCTSRQYGDFEMYVDWKLEPSPEADAGIYLRGSPQVQIWNIARTNVGAQVGSGGLYNNKANPSTPLKVADNRLGEWNAFYIKMVGDRVTVILNGVLVVDNVILENYWDRSLPIFPVEQLELQAHGSKVYYRNIYVKELKRPEPFVLSAKEKKEGYRILFDGTNMHEWTGNTVDYTLENGCIALYPSAGHGGNLYTKREFGNFIFRFEFQLTPGANNGLGIRTPLEGDAAYVGMELQILDSEAPIYRDLAPYQYHGSVYGIIPAKRGFLKPAGEWNYQEVVAAEDNIKVTLNGTVIVDGNIRKATKNGTPDKQEHPGLFNKKGHIGFLGHGSHVKFRNIRIKELK